MSYIRLYPTDCIIYKPKHTYCQEYKFYFRVDFFERADTMNIDRWMQKMKNQEDNTDRKNVRREKIKKKNLKKDFSYEDENQEKNYIKKKELKKIKESFDDEEWEDWDRYYNH